MRRRRATPSPVVDAVAQFQCPCTLHYPVAYVVEQLKSARGARSIKTYAAEIGVSFQYLAKVLAGKMPPGDRMLESIGMRECGEKRYEKIP